MGRSSLELSLLVVMVGTDTEGIRANEEIYQRARTYTRSCGQVVESNQFRREMCQSIQH